MKLLVITGSRADYGPLEWLLKCLREDAFFDVRELRVWGMNPADAYDTACARVMRARPDMALVLGDRHEILASVMACHLERVPIAHIGGGDVTEGSYDDAMRDCISRMATLHFSTSSKSADRLIEMGCFRDGGQVEIVGAPGVDYIMHADWKRERPIAEPYVVVSYYPETIDNTVDREAVDAAIAGRTAVWTMQNPDRGSDRLPEGLTFSHAEFLNLIHHADEFIGNSSAILYEAPFMGVKTLMIGKRQRGRVVPFGDGKASERIIAILKAWHDAKPD